MIATTTFAVGINLTTNHDCFGCLAADAADFNRIIRREFFYFTESTGWPVSVCKMIPTAQPHRRTIGKLKIKILQSTPGADADNGSIEQIIHELERLQKDANGIVNTYVDYVAARTGNSFTATRAAIIFPLGSQINFPAALRVIREELVKSLGP